MNKVIGMYYKQMFGKIGLCNNNSNFLKFFREKLNEQEERLRRLEEDMGRIRDSDGMVNDDLDELDAKKKALEDKMNEMNKQKQNITESSPVGEYKFG